MTRRAPTFFFRCLFLAAFASVFSEPIFAADKPVSVETYRAQLQKAQRQLLKMEARAPRKIAPVLQSLAKDQTIKRGDGQTQTAGGDQFKNLISRFSSNISREQTRQIRQSIALHQSELEAWSRSTYAPADAQSIMRELENSGQIRVAPTWFQQWKADLKKWFKQKWNGFTSWLGDLFPSRAPGKLPSVDPNWVRAIFTISVLALLAAIGFLVWRAVGGNMGRRRKKQGAFAFSPEDAELLSLPPVELRARALRFAEAGNFREALRHLYISLLLNLDARGVWRYDARRTNWEHIAALQDEAGKSTLVAPLSSLTRRFDRVRYGNARCGQSDWTEFERDVSALEASTPS